MVSAIDKKSHVEKRDECLKKENKLEGKGEERRGEGGGEEEDDTLSMSSVQSLTTPENTLYSCSSSFASSGAGLVKESTTTTTSASAVSKNPSSSTGTTVEAKQPPIVNWSPNLLEPSTSNSTATDTDGDDDKADDDDDEVVVGPPVIPKLAHFSSSVVFVPHYYSTRAFCELSRRFNMLSNKNSVWIGFWALWTVTCANSVLTPMRDAIALAVGVTNLPKLTVASTVLALFSSVPIGWLFEAPDPQRRKLWKRMGLTRGETQGTSLALFYRFFAISLVSYAIGFKLFATSSDSTSSTATAAELSWTASLLSKFGQGIYVAFFLVVHLMKLHSLSLVWGVITEAMEYEDVASKEKSGGSKTRFQRLSFIGFGGTLGGILGSIIASRFAHTLGLSGLLIIAAGLLELSAELSIELGRIMQLHWSRYFRSSDDLASLDTSMKRSSSLGSMKRVASGNSLHRIKSSSELNGSSNNGGSNNSSNMVKTEEEPLNDTSFTQRLLRGVTTILRSRLLMAIFTYNALYASTTVLLSFQRAALVANRNSSSSTVSDTAFLANINMASSVAVFALQASGLGAYVAHKCGSRGTLTLMPLMRLFGILGLAWWHQSSNGKPPNLILFLVLDECTRVLNLAVAKPVRESLWRGLSNEARYEAKPIVDTLANRWGGGSAAFLVSLMDKLLDIFGVQTDPNNGSRLAFGYPPILLQCLIVAAWWTAVSVDLGQIRRRIDLELKKHL